MINIILTLRVCYHCKQEKSLPEFDKDKHSYLGYSYKCKICRKELRELNKEKHRAAVRDYYESHKEEHSIRMKKWGQKQKNSVNRRIKSTLRSRFYKFTKGKNKSESILTIVGCSHSEFRFYIESQFKKEMNWENYGSIWELDHIIPCSKFDLTESEDQRKCFHYTNYQPLFKTTSIAESLGYNEIGNRNKYNNL